MTLPESELLKQFEAFEINPGEFGHRQHVQVAFEMLHKYNYLETCAKYAQTIHKMATHAGVEEKFNLTITLAFLSLIAERVHGKPRLDFETFEAQNPDLMSRSALDGWYSSEDLGSEFARTHFLLPRKVA